ncbi:bifunctional 4-hydroxy-2-oxoglutarate aldolase/2-dehydro-3-deoxy-phosphogluconate aldolase [Phycicoccus flavus]|uniref:bifunctional 4-hydroxy-2-oxoglutarate aldolase/2-dehydro-3-deoxy-phosphogluconate aldolase n=1 Tax=Phycicoccus flavus TaxID=2502783 RepID=UPI000FEBF45B|nr:bifunctional 4-hydroxy-2-oxoglutarate aldolase/2-dehydro-3-deoxy-phosphogluconate aldolase [Phycicoccus flavus]NHA68249.1 bifunctional 4-hydroxy-2-oxoglutarate aldolase/2-dehydro-3-deoxy-phosphogluconate aldolase [Phycicoccus flavus]
MSEPETVSALGRLAASPVIAILRGGDLGATRAAGHVLVEHGVRWLEVTTNSPGWVQAVADLADTGAEVGAGTVRTARQAHEAVAAGARFLVCPDTFPEVGEAAQSLGVPWFPGAATATEIAHAHRLGATAVKIFPAAQCGGPAFLKAVAAPLDDIPLVPTGGIALDDIDAYLAAGAVAVGLGSPLLGDSLTGGSLDDLATRTVTAMTEAGLRG